MTYQYLLFDADDTLFDFDKGSRRAFQKAMKENGIDATDSDYDCYAAINLALWKQFEKGEIAKEDILTKRYIDYFAVCPYTADPLAVNESYKRAMCEQNILMPDALSVITELHRRGFRLFIITNGDAAIQHKRLKESPITPMIEKVFISEEIGYAKPAKGFFDAVMTGIDGFDRARALVIGDSESSDMLGAQNAGLDACFFSPQKATLPDGIAAKYQIASLRELLTLL